METQLTTITRKGQVTIPAAIRKSLGLKTGDQVRFVMKKNKKVEVKPEKRFSIMSLYGSLKPKIRYKKNDDVYEIIKKEEQAFVNAAIERDNKTLIKPAEK